MPDVDSRSREVRRSALAIAALFLTFGAIEGSWASRIPLITQQLGLSDLGLSAALAGPAVGLIAATLIAPIINRRVGSGRVASRAALAGAAGLVLPALAWNVASLAVALVMWGTALGLLDISMNAQGLALERRLGGSAFSRLHASYSLAVLGFAPLGGLANHLGVDPLAHFALVAAVCLVCLQPLRGAMLPDVAAASPSASTAASPSASTSAGAVSPGPGVSGARLPAAASRLGPDARRQLILLAIIGFCALVAEGSVGNWSGVLLRRNDHVSLALAPFGLTTFSAGMTVGRWRGDWFITRFGYRAVARAAGIVAATGMVIGVATPWLATAMAGYAVLGLGLAVLVPIVFALAGRVPGVAPVRAMARVTTMTYGGLFIGPPLVGLIASATTLRIALLAVAGLVVFAAVISGRAISEPFPAAGAEIS